MVYINTPDREFTHGPQRSPTEPDDVTFRTVREVDEYAEKNGLRIIEGGGRRDSSGRTSYKYCAELEEVLEVGQLRNIEGFAREVQEKHPEYSWKKCLRIARKAQQKEERHEGKK